MINRLFRPSGCRLTAGKHNQPSGRHVWLLNHSTTTSLGHKVVIGYVLAPQACRSPPAFPARCAWRVSRSGVEARFKKLARVARAVLGVPNTNAECERDFSLAKLLLAAQRKSMSAETFSRMMFLAKNRALWEPNPELK